MSSTQKKRDSLLDHDRNIEIFEPDVVAVNDGDNEDSKFEFMTIDKSKWNTPGLEYFTQDNDENEAGNSK